MEITEITEMKNGRRKILLENGCSFVLYKGEVRRFQLEEGACISEEQWLEIRNEILVKRAKLRAMHLLEKMDRTEQNLRQKLKEGGYTEDIVDEAVSYVKSYHYIDDERYASVYVRTKQGSKSRMQMKMELLKKGIDAEMIQNAFEEECPENEDALIQKILEKKHYDPENADENEKRKVYQYLARRGFKNSDIRRGMRL